MGTTGFGLKRRTLVDGDPRGSSQVELSPPFMTTFPPSPVYMRRDWMDMFRSAYLAEGTRSRKLRWTLPRLTRPFY